MTEIRPNLKTRPDEYSGNERVKLSTDGLRLVVKDINSAINVQHQFMDPDFEEISEAAETIAKSYGIYTDFNRAKTGDEKEWMYMLRITVPGGGPLTRKQWDILDDVAERYTVSSTYTGKPLPSLRLTTRQNIQLHWIKKKDVIDAVRDIARSGFYTINGCGDNVRNVMGCPLSRFSGPFNANDWAQKAGKYFRLPTAAYIEIFGIDPAYIRKQGAKTEGDVDGDEGGHFRYGPNLLNRKFKIAFSSIMLEGDRYVADNCVELRTNDIGIAPILEDGRVRRFQVYIGGGQGEKQGYPTFAAMGQPFGIFDEAHLLAGLDAIVAVHQEWGDRQNRHWARLKYVLYKMGVEWFRQQVRAKSIDFDAPIEDLDYGTRNLHQGWMKQDSTGLLCYGAFIENGRLIDGPNGQLKTMVRYLMDNYGVDVLITPNQDLIFANLHETEKNRFEEEMKRFGFGLRDGRPYSQLRLLSGACVGRDTCRLTYTDSEKFEPSLIDGLEGKWGNLHESIGITGCERQCFRPATKSVGWVGAGFNLYQLKIGGTEDARNQGGPLIDPDTNDMYLRLVPRADVQKVTEALFEFYVANASPDELNAGGMGYFFKRVGPKKVIEALKANPQTAKLMTRTIKSPLADEPGFANPSLSPAPGAQTG